MNKARLVKLRDHIAQLPPERIDMRAFTLAIGPHANYSPSIKDVAEDEDCGTAACIAGWTVALFDPQQPNLMLATQAKNLLDLTQTQADSLFYPTSFYSGKITQAQVIKALDSLINVGRALFV